MILKKFFYKLPNSLKNIILRLSYQFNNNIEDDFIFNPDIGKKYNLTIKDKKKLIKSLKYSITEIDSATDLNIHFVLLKKILELEPNNKASIVECGVYKGATSIVLSIAAKITGRQLILYDSFEGLPDGEKSIPQRNYLHLKVTGSYKKGMYAGTLEEVKNNILKFGEINSCIFRKGYFNKSLINHKEKIDFLFLDVDLVSSTKDCIFYLWNYLVKGGYCYTDDACDIDVVKVWFDDEWWKKNLKCEAPGYIGSGCGLPINPNISSLGYTLKSPNLNNYKDISWLQKK
jgi:O-methyltransferase